MYWVIYLLVRFALWRFGMPRVITGRGDEGPYLTRYYLLGGPRTEGMGDQSAGKHFGLYLHHFHRSDDAGDLHNHPWRWAFSFVLAGGYSEERIESWGYSGKFGSIKRRNIRPMTFNFISSRDFHRVDLHPGKPAWTLFFSGPRTQSWGFLTRFGRRFIPWRTYCGLE